MDICFYEDEIEIETDFSVTIVIKSNKEGRSIYYTYFQMSFFFIKDNIELNKILFHD